MRTHHLIARSFIAGACVLGFACTFDLDAVPPPGARDLPTIQIVDRGRADLRWPPDGRVPDRHVADGRRDGLAPDTRKSDLKPDLLKPDLLKPDLLKPDLLKPDQPPPPPKSCNAIYGAAPGYQFCDEKPGSCKFYVNANSTCGAICGQYQGTCIGAQNNATWRGANKCTAEGPILCSTKYLDQICECTR